MAQVSTITQPFYDYYNTLPTRLPKALIQSGAVSFAFSAFITNNLDRSLLTGALAASVTLISALTMPLFKKAFANEKGNLSWFSFGVIQTVNLGLTQLAVNSLTSHKVNLLGTLFFTVFLLGWVRDFNDIDPNISAPYFIVS
jgi:hypothetical protein